MQKQVPMTGSTLRANVNYVWDIYFKNHAQTATIRMAKNRFDSPNSTFTITNLSVLKVWMLAWKKHAFDTIIGFDTHGIQNLNQDLYREITSYTWSEMNDATLHSLENEFAFVGNEYEAADDGSGIKVARPRKTVALEKIATAIERKSLDIVSKECFKAFFISTKFAKKRAEWAARVSALRRANEEAEAEVVVPIVEGTAVETSQCQWSTADTAQLAAAAAAAAAVAAAVAAASASAAAASASAASAAAAAASATPPPLPPPVVEPPPVVVVDPPPVVVVAPPVVVVAPPVVASVFTVDDLNMAVPPPPPPTPIVLEPPVVEPPVVEPPVVEPPPPPPTPVVTSAERSFDVDCEMLELEFDKTHVWAASNVNQDKLMAERVEIDGFLFYCKYRATVSAKTNGKRDSYCSIAKGSRAERMARKAGIDTSKASGRTLRSKKDMQRFWAKILNSGAENTA